MQQAAKFRMRGLFTTHNLVVVTSIVILLVVWEIVARMMASEQILPGPLQTIETLVKLVAEPSFMPALGHTLLRGLYGFILALFAGLLIGMLSGLHPLLEAGFRPILVTIRSVPVISLILLALIWLEVESVPVFIGFLTMFPIIARNTSDGIKQTNHSLIEMARIYRIPTKRIILEIHFPSLIPFMMNGFSSAIGFGWRAVIIGEVLSQPKYGIGSMMQDAQSFLLVPELIAWTLVAVAIGFVFESMLVSTEKKLLRWS